MADIRVDTAGVSVTTFQIAGIAGNLDGAHGVTVSLDPGDYLFEQVAGSPFGFTVTGSGTIEFDQKYAGFLTGAGTATLTVTGFPITIDGRAIPYDLRGSYWYIGPDGTDTLPRDQTRVVKVLPMTDPEAYRLMLPNGDFTAAAFTVSLDGHLAIKAEYRSVFGGDGTTTLTVTGFPITIDGRAVPYDLRAAYWYVGADGTNGLPRDQTHVIPMLPVLVADYYHFMLPNGDFTAAAFNVTFDGQLDIAPQYRSVFGGHGTTTLVVTGFPITIDGRAVPYDLRAAYWYVGADGTNGLPRDQTHVIPMLPVLVADYYHFMLPNGDFTAAAFNVTFDGQLDIAPQYRSVFGGHGTTTLVVTGFPITIDGRAVPYDLRAAYWYVGADGTNGLPRDQTHVIPMLPVLVADYYRFMDAAGSTFTAAAFNVTFDGQLDIAPQYRSVFGGHGTTTLVVTGFPITIDGRSLPHDLGAAYWYVGPDGGYTLSRDQTHVINVLPMLDPETYRFLAPTGQFTAAAFNVSLDGQLVIKPDYAKTFAGDGTSTLTVTGFPITIDGRSLPHDLGAAYWYVGPDGGYTLSRDQTHVINVLPMLDPETYRFLAPTGQFTAAAFNVSLDGQLVIKPDYAKTFAGDGTSTLTVTGFPITIDGRALPHDLRATYWYVGADGTDTLTRDQTHQVAVLPMLDDDTYRFLAPTAQFTATAFNVTLDGRLIIKPEYRATFAGDGTTTLNVTGFPITIDGRALTQDLALDGFGGLVPTLTHDIVHAVQLLPLLPQGPYVLETQPQPGPTFRFVVNVDGTVTQLDPSPPWIYGTPRVTPTQARSRVAELRRAVEQAESVVNRYDTLVRFAAVGDRFTTASATAQIALNAARKALAEAVSKEPPIWTDAHPVPALLVPVRLETRYRPNPQHPDADTALAIRIIPDDVAVHTFQPELTDTEYQAAVDYWTTASASGATDDTTSAAWAGVLKLLGPARAAWAVEATTPTFAADGTPRFPDTPRRTKAWTRAATSLLLPDRFVFRGWRGGRLVFEIVGATIPDDLAIGPDPEDLNGPVPALGWSSASAWMVDFDEAVRVGMGALVPLSGPDVAFDEITALGISERSPDEAAARVARSLQGQLYTRGLAFPRYGTPTNNTAATRSQWSSAPAMRTPAEVTAAVAAGTPGSGQPAILLADALGLDPNTAPPAAGRRDLLAAQGGTDRDDEAALRDAAEMIGLPFFITPDPSAPATPDAQPEHTGWITTESALDHFTAFVRARGPLPAIRAGRQPYGILPVTSTVLWSTGTGESVPAATVDLLRRLRGLIGRFLPMSPRIGRGTDQDDVLMGLLRRSPESVALSGTFGDEFAEPGQSFMNIPSFATDTQVIFEALINYYASLTSLPTTPAGNTGDPSDPLTTVLAAAGVTAPSWLSRMDTTAHKTGFLWHMMLTLFGMMLLSFFGMLAEEQKALSPTATPDDRKAFTDLVAYLRSLLERYFSPGAVYDRFARAASIDQGSLERQIASISEALSFRVDAWATSLATARLHTLRSTAPTGIRIGAYGWLVDVEPIAPGVQKADAGWVLTPSMQHAATAAVLHSGWAAHAAPQAFAVDLTSERVRRAQATLSALRDGRTLEELLGYQLERSLHDQNDDELIAPLRQAFPLPPADPAHSDTPDNALVARAEHGNRLVVDGDAARHSGANFDQPTLSADQKKSLDDQKPLLVSLFAELDDTVDAMGDVLLAESVHQLVGGSALRAGLTADTVGRANPVPERLDVLTTPHDQVAVTHTVGLAVAYTDPPAISARAQLDPAADTLAAWALGDLDTWKVVVTTPAGTTDVSDLSDLGVAAIDVVIETTEPVDASALAARIRQQRRVDGTAQITRHDGLGGEAALSTLAATIRTLLADARPCLPGADPLAAVAPGTALDIPGLITRIQTWWAAVREKLAVWPEGSDQDQAAAIRALAGLGLVGARFDAPPAVGAALQQRWGQIELVPQPPTERDELSAWLAGVRDQVRVATGEWFLCAPSWSAGGHGWSALAGQEPGGEPVGADEVEDWLAERRDVRAGVTALTDALLATGAVGEGISDWMVRQQQPASTAAPVDGWVARQHPGTRSAAHLAAIRVGPADGPSRTLLAIDQWVETVPAAPRSGAAVPDQTAGLGFRFDRPDARAPQALLLVTPPDLSRGWCLEDLHAAVDETLWWTRARPLDGTDLPEVGQRLSKEVPSP